MANTLPNPDLLLACQERAQNNAAHNELVSFVDQKGHVSESLTNAAIWQQSGSIAFALVKQFKPGDKLLLVYTPGIDFVLAFLACMRAEIVAVPIPPPDLSQNGAKAQEESRKFIAIVNASGAVGVLTNQEYHQAKNLTAVKKWIKSWVWTDNSTVLWPDLPWIVTNSLRFGSETLPAQTTPTPPDRVAFLQFTSGSTSQPKGVRITFRNIRHQLEANAVVLGMNDKSCSVCWMPHFHDFALISHICSAFIGNGRLILLSPLSFLAKPILWIELIQRYGATHIACPPFALSILVKKTTPEQRAALKLHTISSLLLAADAIKASVIDEFCKAFEVAGFRREMIRTAYGLAEHCVGITMTTAKDAVVDISVDSDILYNESRIEISKTSPYSIVSCGVPLPGVVVRVVDQDKALPDGFIGEVWANSDSKADGYEGLPELSETTFQARIEGDDQRSYVRTGDLGFMWKGQLYITGRLKEIIKVYGRTIHPVDIELCATQSSDLLRPGSVCAFAISLDDGGDRLVILAEVVKGANPDQDAIHDLVDTIRQAILATFSVPCQAVILGRPGQLVRKTTSGKVQRAQLRNWYLQGKFTRSADLSPQSPVSKALLHVSTIQSPKASVPSRSFSFQVTPDASVNEQRLRRLCAAAHEAGFAGEIRQLVSLSAALAPPRIELQPKCPFQKRVFHATGVGASGPIRMAGFGEGLFGQEDLNAAVRFSNFMFADDRHPQIRGASFRIYSGDDYENPLFDLIFLTGDGRAVFPTADLALKVLKDHSHVMTLPPSHPLRDAHRCAVRKVPDSYAELHWFAIHTYSWHSTHWARFRFRHRDSNTNLPPYSNDVNCDLLDLRPDSHDQRDASFLKQRFSEECRSGDGQQYVIEVQIRPKSKDEQLDLKLQDGLIPWDDCPWQPFADVVLDNPLPDTVVEGLRFNVVNSPADVEIVCGADAHHPASSAHARAITYAIASHVRCGIMLPDYLAAFSNKNPSPYLLNTLQGSTTERPTVVVIGGGVSGLAAAMSLERRGYQVTVLEAAPNVGGKASSLWIDKKVYDWGGHLCNNSYHCVRALVNRFGLKIEPAAPPHLFNCQDSRSTICNIFENRGLEQFRKAMYSMTENFGVRDRVSAPLTEWASSVKVPWRQWIEDDPKRKMWLWPVVLQMNSCGYGFSLDHEVPLAFLAKLIAVSDEFSSVGWTLETGMQSLYDAMGATLDDLRLNSTVAGIERRDGSAYVRLSSDETIVADHVISSLTVPQTVALLANPSETERAVARDVHTFSYYTTIARCKGLEKYPIGFHVMDQHNEPDLALKNLGHVVAWHKRYTDSDIFLFYSFAPDLQSDDLVQRFVREDVVQILGGELIKIVAQRAFDFFPYASYPDHFYPKLSKIQGHQHLWHIGSIFNIELMEGNIGFAQRMVQNHFPVVNDGALFSPSPNSIPGVQRKLTATERYIAEAILAESTESFDPELVGPSDKIANFGITSIALPALASKFSEYTGAHVRLLDCAMYPSIKELGAFLDRLRQESQRSFQCIKTVRPGNEETGSVLFMIHDGVGRTHQYISNSPRFNFPLSLVQPYWEEANVDVIASLDEVAALYVSKIRAEQPQGPWRLGGFSMGAMLAWRMSQMLGDVDRLVLIDCPDVPHQPGKGTADAGTVDKLRKQFLDLDQSEHGRVLRDQIPKMSLLPGTRSAPTLVIAGSQGIVQEMQLASTAEMRQSWELAIGHQLRFISVDGASHMDIMNAPHADQVFSEIQQFLK